ncbi:MAG: MATE family efflux transporter [Fastidiosipilaceae bacterium]
MRIFKELIGGGLPAFCLVALAMLSNCFLNSMLSKLGNEAVAGVGVVRKIDHLAYAVNQGVTQGMLPLVAYSYSAGRKTFMKQIILLAAAGTELFSLISTTLSCIFASQLVAFFIKDPTTVGWGAQFLRVLSLAIPVYSLTFVIIAVFQAVGRSLEPLFISILHKGSLDILLLFIIRRNFGFEHIVWAAPVTEAVGLIFALILFWTRSKQFKVTN